MEVVLLYLAVDRKISLAEFTGGCQILMAIYPLGYHKKCTEENIPTLIQDIQK